MPRRGRSKKHSNEKRGDDKKVRARATLTWLRDLLAWCSEDPINRIETVIDEVSKHSEEVRDAFAEAIEPEFREYMNFIVNNLTSIGGENGSGA